MSLADLLEAESVWRGKRRVVEVQTAKAFSVDSHPTQQVGIEHTHKQDRSALLSALDAHNVAKTLTQSEAPLMIEGDAAGVVEEQNTN